jgi:hypothetical protein
MNLQLLSDSQLIQELKTSVLEERKKTALVLEYLHEVDRRRLYADSGYSSLWEFCIHELDYSEASASRRISAMKLIREMPELKGDLLSGKQNLSSLSKAKHFFQLEEKHQGETMTTEEKKEILRELENKSSRECDRTLIELSSVPIEISNPQRERPLDATHTQLTIVLKDEVYYKLKRIQALRSHANPTMSYEDLLNYMADEILKRLDPLEKLKTQHQPERGDVSKARGGVLKVSEESTKLEKAETRESSEPKVQNSDFVLPPTSEVIKVGQKTGESEKTEKAKNSRPRRSAIPRALARTIWKRDQGQCTWADSLTGKLCQSRVYLEFDHIIPVSRGGTNRLENLRLRCRAHNQREWIKISSSRPYQTG